MKKMLILMLSFTYLYSSEHQPVAPSKQSRYEFLAAKLAEATSEDDLNWYEGLINNEGLSSEKTTNQTISDSSNNNIAIDPTPQQSDIRQAILKSKKPSLRDRHEENISKLNKQIDYLSKRIIYDDDQRLETTPHSPRTPEWEKTESYNIYNNGNSNPAGIMVLPSKLYDRKKNTPIDTREMINIQIQKLIQELEHEKTQQAKLIATKSSMTSTATEFISLSPGGRRIPIKNVTTSRPVIEDPITPNEQQIADKSLMTATATEFRPAAYSPPIQADQQNNNSIATLQAQQSAVSYAHVVKYNTTKNSNNPRFNAKL